MNRITIGAALLALLSPARALCQDAGWRVTSLRAVYDVRSDGSIGVVERVGVDFGFLHRHGIYRDLKLGWAQELRVDRVTDGEGRPLPVDMEGIRRIRIRIGDPQRTVTGAQSYEIRYAVSGAVRFLDSHDELYWQVTGTESAVPVEQAEAVVTLPSTGAGQHWEGSEARCYAGQPESSSGARCAAAVAGPGHYRYAAEGLAPGEGLTLVAAFPKGVITEPGGLARLRSLLFGLVPFAPLGLLPATLGLLVALWLRVGRDPPTGSVAPQWRLPEEIRPGPAGALVDQRVDTRDIVATVLDLAVRGFVRIRPADLDGARAAVARVFATLGWKEWRLELVDGERRALRIYERLILDAVFGDSPARRLSDLGGRLQVHRGEIRRALFADLIGRKLVPQNPEATRRRWAWGGFALLVAGAACFPFGREVPGLGIAGSGVLVMLFSKVMPTLTPRGARLRRHLLGLEEYIRRAEKAELDFREAPDRSPQRFSEVLPYAVALGVTDSWVRQFAGALSEPLPWYGGDLSGLDGADLTSLFGGFEDALCSAFDSVPGADVVLDAGVHGLGSVGGGGGGGGFGDW
jgi:hypothetical protein